MHEQSFPALSRCSEASRVNDYSTFLASKARSVEKAGIIVRRDDIHKRLFHFQTEIVQRMLELGRGAIFASTGLGKTGMQIEWARQVHKHEGVDVLIFAPLAVASQTAREAQLLDVASLLAVRGRVRTHARGDPTRDRRSRQARFRTRFVATPSRRRK
jgi:hypothetical protein